MCLTLPWKVIAIDADVADVESAGVRQRVMRLTVPDLRVDDYVVVSGSVVVRRMSAEAAAGITRALTAAKQQPSPADAGQ